MTYEEIRAFAAVAGFIIFVAGFALVLIYVFLPSNKKPFDQASRLPLDKDTDDNSPRGHYGQT
jgi:cytochrome c oxidase cbb3-type subunit IV